MDKTQDQRESTIPEPGFWKRVLTIRNRPSAVERLAMGVIGVLIPLLIWHALTMGAVPEERIISPVKLPSVSETFSSFKTLWYERALSRSIVKSLGRVFGGFSLAIALALPLGVLAGCYFRLDALLRPLSVFGRSVPIAALIPLTVLWFGIEDWQKVMFIFVATLSFILFDTTNRIQTVSDRFLDAAYTLGAHTHPRYGALRALVTGMIYAFIIAFASTWLKDPDSTTIAGAMALPKFWIAWGVGLVIGFGVWFPIFSNQVISKVILPLAMPSIVNSLRLLFGLAFGYIMLAEAINAKGGLGDIIIRSERRGFTEHILLILIIIALLAYAIDRATLWLQHRLFPYVRNVEN